MSAPRFFVDAVCVVGSEVSLEREDARHAQLVLRLRKGDAVNVVCEGAAWDAVLTDIGASGASARISAARSETGGELPVAVTVMQALIKGTKFDFVVEKAVELGARHIVPVHFGRSESQAGLHRLDRWRRIARAAAQQSRRRVLPTVAEPVAWPAALQQWGEAQPPILAYENAAPGSLGKALEHFKPGDGLAIAIGPEGGLAPADLEVANEAGCALVSLGPTTLRTETAALAMLAAVAARLGWW